MARRISKPKVGAPIQSERGSQPKKSRLDKLGSAVNGAFDRAGGTLRVAGNQVDRAGNRLDRHGVPVLDRFVKELGKATVRAGDALADAPERVDAGADAVVSSARKLWHDLETALDYGKSIDALGKGDSYTLGLGGWAYWGPVFAFADGSIRVAKNAAGNYAVEIEGDAGVGLALDLDVAAGVVGATGYAEGSVSAGAAVEFTVDTAEEAKRAVHDLLRLGINRKKRRELSTGAELAEAKAFLRRRVSAVEIRGGAALEFMAGLYGPAEGLAARVAGKGAVAGQIGVRFEFPDGAPPEVVFRESVSASLKGALDFNLSLGEAGSVGLSNAKTRGQVSAGLKLEQRFTLPEQVNRNRLLTQPLDTVRQLHAQLRASTRTKAVVQLESQHKSKFRAVTAEFVGDTSALVASGALARAFRGQLHEAFQRAGDAEVQVNVRELERVGLNKMPKFSVPGLGVIMAIRSFRNDVDDDALWSFSGRAADAGESLERAVG